MVTKTARARMPIAGESPVSANEICRDFPGRGKVHIATVRRWITHGVRLQGRTIKLYGWRVGCNLYTTREAAIRFVEEQNVELEPAAPPTTHAAQSDAGERLKRMGA